MNHRDIDDIRCVANRLSETLCNICSATREYPTHGEKVAEFINGKIAEMNRDLDWLKFVAKHGETP